MPLEPAQRSVSARPTNDQQDSAASADQVASSATNPTLANIVIRGAQEHNLQNVNLDLPRHKLTVLTGVSGSGKSSLAFDTVFKEGQRRYLESLSAYARQFLGQMEKPRVEHIAGLSPTVAVDQKTTNRNPRSTVGTITEIYDYLRVLFARVGTPHCPTCGQIIERQSPEQIVDRILGLPTGMHFSLLAPIVRGRKGEYREDLAALKASGYARARIDGEIRSLDEPIELSRYKRHTIEVIVDRLAVGRESEDRSRLADSVETALELGKGLVVVLIDRPAPANRRPEPPDKPKPRRSRRGTSSSADSEAAERESTSAEDAAGGSLAGSASDGQATEAASPPTRPDDENEWLLSKYGGCPRCGVNLPELEPRLFSFNSTFGACPACGGLGKKLEVDPDLLVPDKTRSIRGRALACTNDNGYILYSRLDPHGWEQLAGQFGFSLDTPWQDLAPEHQRLILHGSGRGRFEHHWRWQSVDGTHVAEGTNNQRFQGIVPILRLAYAHNPADHIARFMSSQPCPKCHGARLRADALAVTFAGRSIVDLAASSVAELAAFFDASHLALTERQQSIAGQLLREIRARLGFLRDVGLTYLTLDRTADTLAGGEAQRLRLAAQLGAGLEGVLYVLDEPSIGLHHRDNQKLLGTLRRLRDRGNTVLVVEHDEDTIRQADHVVDFGPGAGRLGGHVIAADTPANVALVADSLTGQFLRHELVIEIPKTRRPGSGQVIRIVGAREHNLRNVDVSIPLGALVCVTGVSGSGKSTLVDDVLKKSLARQLQGAQEAPGAHDRIEGIEHIDKVIEIDQSPIGRTPRSNPATYTGVMDHIRALFADLPESRVRGYKPGRFSFNVKGGRCEACGGGGTKIVEMQFLADVEVSCEVCGGKRFNNETLRVKFRDKTISEVLAMTVAEARDLFSAIPVPARILQTLLDVGLGYISLGQSSTTLSGGEAQRIKLAEQLARPATGHTLYILDEPTTGLHFVDVQRLLGVLQRLVDLGNTVLVVEHNPDVIKVADYIVDLGPEGGAGGGLVIAEGTPEQVAKASDSYTGQMLEAIFAEARASAASDADAIAVTSGKLLPPNGTGSTVALSSASFPVQGIASNGHSVAIPTVPSAVARAAPSKSAPRVIAVRGARKHNLKGIDVDIPKNTLTVVTGVSGSGKSSLAIDTIFAEGQRRFVECLSSYARQFLGRLDDAAVERIDGLAPAIAIDQKYGVRSPRSTVATATELYDYLRLLFARLGQPHCPVCQHRLVGLTSSEIVQAIASLGAGTRAYLLAPIDPAGEEDPNETIRQLKREGYARAWVDGHEVDLAHPPKLATPPKVDSSSDESANDKPARAGSDDEPSAQVTPSSAELATVVSPDFDSEADSDGDDEALAKPALVSHPRIEVVIDRIVIDPADIGGLADSVELALARGGGSAILQIVEPGSDRSAGDVGQRHTYSSRPSCPDHGIVLEDDLSPRLFSPNYHAGACTECKGLGVSRSLAPDLLVPNPDLSYLEGALALIPASDAKDHRFTHIVRAVASHYGFSLDTPWRDLTPAQRRLILYGTGGQMVTVHREHKGERSEYSWTSERAWVGFIPQFMRWYRRTKNANWAQWLEGYMSDVICPACDGEKLKPLYRAFRLGGQTIGQIGRMSVREAREFFVQIQLSQRDAEIAAQALKEVNDRLKFLGDVGLDYLTLDRMTATLSGGEAQRIRLATQVGAKLVDALYVLDEPSIGLHQRDVARLLRTLVALRDLGNTVIVVEHDEEVIRAADHLIDVGPGAGAEGGRIVAAGTVAEVMATPESLTGAYLRGGLSVGQVRSPAGARHSSHATNRPVASGSLVIRDASEHNLKHLDVAIPLGQLVAVTGVSGSGKSTLVSDVLERALSRRLNRARVTPGAHRAIDGIDKIERIVAVDQHPIGRSSKSNPATYTGVFDAIRDLFAQLPEARARGYTKSRFSFNESKGWCSRCQGEGVNKISMHFLADVEVTCEGCGGRRYNADTLAVKFHGKSIADVLDMRAVDAAAFFGPIPTIRPTLDVMVEVGLGYLTLGQSSNSLSGGEAQRVKLSAELCRSSTGRTIYILDEPTVGLHFADVARLLDVLRRLVDSGNSVVVVEHNLDVIAAADYVIDLGPEGGDLGGYVIATGTPSEVAEVASSATGEYLKQALATWTS